MRTVALAFAACTTLACITGPGPKPAVDCVAITLTGIKSCTCTSVDRESGSGGACPAANAPATVCCAEIYYPEYSSRQCRCTEVSVGCEANTGPYCECHQIFDSTKPMTKACVQPTTWAVCCGSSSSGCTCYANPGVSCLSNTVAKCDATITPGALCVINADGLCSCSTSNKTGAATCPPPPPLVCCSNESEGWCRCDPGGTCPTGSKGVPSCTTDVIAPIAATAAKCGSALESRVKSCSPVVR